MRSLPLLALLSLIALPARAQPPRTWTLDPSSKTVAWGHYDPKSAPVLRVRSGDTVVMRTLLTNSPTGLEKMGVKPADVEPALREVFEHVTDKGPGGHILTGPVYVAGAEPGDTLEVRILRIDLAIPYAYNGFRYGLGLLTDDYPYARQKLIPLDAKTMTAAFAPGITLALHPFFGSMGVAPPAGFGRYDSTAPTVIGGNMDDKDLVAGSTVFFPVFAPGALFEAGDGHAGQGDGEVDVTAMETSLIGTFQFIVHKGGGLKNPRAETPTHYIAMGFDDDLAVATRKAVREMVDFLVASKGMNKDDAYMLTSVAGDLHITEVVDRNKGVHMTIPKAAFAR